MNEDEIINYLNNNGGCFEVYHKTSFTANRKAKDGTTQQLDIDIFDAGSTVNQDIRYYCEARTKDGKTATSNPVQSIQEALNKLRWYDLDAK